MDRARATGLRRIGIAIVAIGLAPGLWLRGTVPPHDFMPPLAIERIAVEPEAFGPFRLERAWRLVGNDPQAGGYSALLWRGGERLLAASDNGRMIELEGPDFRSARQRPIFTEDAYDKVSGDVEAMTGSGGRGPVWVAVEGSNAIARAGDDLHGQGRVRPASMAGWKANSGPETLVRLGDGRFVVVAERGTGGLHLGAIFASDPLEHPAAEGFRMLVPGGYRPVDAVAALDGTVLVLLRRIDWGVPPGFRSAIARYDLSGLKAGGIWRPRDRFALPDVVPSENYEGIALRPEAGSGATIWLISDDNLSGLQQSLLLRLRYAPKREKARGRPARPSR